MRLRQIKRKGNGLADADMALAVQQQGGGLAIWGAGINHRRAAEMFNELDGRIAKRGRLRLWVYVFGTNAESEWLAFLSRDRLFEQNALAGDLDGTVGAVA